MDLLLQKSPELGAWRYISVILDFSRWTSLGYTVRLCLRKRGAGGVAQCQSSRHVEGPRFDPPHSTQAAQAATGCSSADPESEERHGRQLTGLYSQTQRVGLCPLGNKRSSPWVPVVDRDCSFQYRNREVLLNVCIAASLADNVPGAFKWPKTGLWSVSPHSGCAESHPVYKGVRA